MAKQLSPQAVYSREQSAKSADIGSIRPVKNPDRKKACRLDLFKFLTTYFPESTGLRPFSDDHRRIISRIEACILHGGRMANVVYRGFAKTTISENSVLWALLYGHRRFIPMFGANEELASGNIDSIKMELQENDLLDEDFPEVTQAVRALEGKPQRCASQTCEGLPTFIEWTADKIVLPTVHRSPCSGAAIVAKGLTGASRGMKHKRPDGTQQRPDFVLIDDPQTDESAASPAQVKKRMNVIAKSILKMAGHRSSIACVVNGTVIQPDDLMDTLLDQKKSSAWQSERIPMIKQWAESHETLWLEEYAAIRRNFDPQLVGDQQRAHRAANDFYVANRIAMDAGCEASWDWCYIEETPEDSNAVPEISSIQHAYNILIDDGPEVFASECQCQPIRPGLEDSPAATKEQILSRIVGIERGVVPNWAERLTAFIDVQGSLLYWIVTAWRSDFTGHIVDYGAFPDQKRPYFTLAEAKNLKRTLKEAFPGASDEGLIHDGLDRLTRLLLGREWRMTGGNALRIERLLIDRGFSPHLIDQFIERSPFSAMISTAKGVYYGAKTRIHMSDYKKRDGEVFVNEGWIITNEGAVGKRRFIKVDTNRWKSFVHSRLKMATGDRGSLTLCADPGNHQMLIDHLTAEHCDIRTSEQTMRTCEEWEEKKVGEDNHFFDCLVGSAVAASVLGCRLSGDGKNAFAPKKARVPLSQMGR